MMTVSLIASFQTTDQKDPSKVGVNHVQIMALHEMGTEKKK